MVDHIVLELRSRLQAPDRADFGWQRGFLCWALVCSSFRIYQPGPAWFSSAFKRAYEPPLGCRFACVGGVVCCEFVRSFQLAFFPFYNGIYPALSSGKHKRVSLSRDRRRPTTCNVSFRDMLTCIHASTRVCSCQEKDSPASQQGWVDPPCRRFRNTTRPMYTYGFSEAGKNKTRG